MALDVVGIHFRGDDPSELLAEMEELAAVADGRGWVNIQPWVDEEDLPAEPPFARAFSATGPPVPTATWIPAHTRRRRRVRANLGLQHPAGRFVVGRLAGAGIELPPGTDVRQDHNRRGLVLALGDDVTAASVVSFALAAMSELAAVAVDDRWVAEVLRHR